MMHHLFKAGLLSVLLWFPIVSLAACPDLEPYQPGTDPDWETLALRLAEFRLDCLDNSEFFAIYGAAQLNTGQLNEAIESLELALLLNPENGAALIDYAQALIQDGQLFAAISANDLLLEREDIPPNLASQVAQRQENWRSLTRQTIWQVDLGGGFDDNLNGAPEQDFITLTLSGEPISLALSEEYRAASGSVLNLRAVGRHRLLTAERQHNFLGELRSRTSTTSETELAQFGARYNFVEGGQSSSWSVSAGFDHLFLSGKPLFSGISGSIRYTPSSNGSCQRYYGIAFQRQHWHERGQLDGLESKLGLGSNCSVFSDNKHRLNAEISYLQNTELEQGRQGGSREGWQAVFDWEFALRRGVLSAQFNHTRLRDSVGYSPLLSFNARRVTKRNTLLVRYRQSMPVFGPSAQFIATIYNQAQLSNIGLFQTRDASAEIGISWQF